MAATAMSAGEMSPATRNNRGKDQIPWSQAIWQGLDHAVMHEVMRTRVAAKFLPHVHVDRKQTTVASDVVIVPVPVAQVPFDPALSVDESATNRINEYWVQFKLSTAQVEAEAHEETAMSHEMPTSQHQEPTGMSHHQTHMHHPLRASTAVSLAMRAANILAQAEDLVIFNGQNAVANSPLFTGLGVQFLDPHLVNDLDLGLLNITPSGQVNLPQNQIIPVHPVPPVAGEGPTPRYAEHSLNAVASAFTQLQALGHYENYALVLNTTPYADLHSALPTTLIEPVEPISHLIKAGIHGTGTLPPFTTGTGPATGLPTTIQVPPNSSPGTQPATILNTFGGNALFTGVLVSLSGNTMDHVSGLMEDHQDVIVTFNQKDQNEIYRFRVVQRHTLRLKDVSAVILMVFLDK